MTGNNVSIEIRNNILVLRVESDGSGLGNFESVLDNVVEKLRELGYTITEVTGLGARGEKEVPTIVDLKYNLDAVKTNFGWLPG